MIIKVKASELREAVSKIITVVDKKNSRPILSYCLLTVQDNKLVFSATDLEVSVKVIVNANTDGQINICINAKNIADILKEMPDEEIILEANEENNILELRYQDIKYSLLICKSDEFPQLVFDNGLNEFQLNSSIVSDVITKTSHAISTDETRLYLNGIYMQMTDSKLRCVATDGHRLALVDIQDFQPNENQSLLDGIIIPKKGVFELKKLADSFSGEKIKLSVDESFLYVSSGDKYFLSIRLIAREYPKYQAVIPSKTTQRMDVDKQAFLTAIKRVKILANEKSNSVKLALKANELTISANHPTLGDATEKIKVDYSGSDLNIGFNAKYLIDTFSIFQDSHVSLEFNNELSPVVIKNQNLPEFLGIVMPMKL